MLKIAIKRQKFIQSTSKLGRTLKTPKTSFPTLFFLIFNLLGGFKFQGRQKVTKAVTIRLEREREREKEREREIK